MTQVFKLLFITLSSWLVFSLSLVGQVSEAVEQDKLEVKSDTISLDTEDKTLIKDIQADNNKRVEWLEKEQWIPNSNTAMLWAILPGGGQIYNRKYWKLPIVWGAFMTCYYSIAWNQRMYNEYHSAYRDIKSVDPSKNTAWLAFAPKGAKPEDYKKYEYLARNLERGNKFYRRYRDLSIVAGILVYGLSVLDAYVDAELATFDISPDLSLQVTPRLMNTPQEPYDLKVGIGCSLRF